MTKCTQRYFLPLSVKINELKLAFTMLVSLTYSGEYEMCSGSRTGRTVKVKKPT